MFESEMSEQKTNQLIIEDIDEQVMKEFLKYLYSRKSDKIEEFKELFYASDKYQVLDLKKILFSLKSMPEMQSIYCLLSINSIQLK